MDGGRTVEDDAAAGIPGAAAPPVPAVATVGWDTTGFRGSLPSVAATGTCGPEDGAAASEITGIRDTVAANPPSE